METQNRFDLNQALARWPLELAQQGVRAPEANELESHMHDSMKELQNRGLSEEEAHWIARHRLGSAPDLAEQFAKADPARVWRDRIVWAAAAMLAVWVWNQLWSLSANSLLTALPRAGLDQIWGARIYLVLTLLPLPVVAVLLSRGRLLGACGWFARSVRTQRQFRRMSAILVVGFLCLQAAKTWQLSQTPNHGGEAASRIIVFSGLFLLNLVWPMALALVLLALRRNPDRAAA